MSEATDLDPRITDHRAALEFLDRRIDYERIPFEAPDLGERKKRKKRMPKDIWFRHRVKEIY